LSDAQANTVARGAKVISEEARAAILAAAGATEHTGTPQGEERESYEALMKAQAEALNELSKQVLAPGPRPRDGLETALSRVEARLTVTEQSLANLEQRVGEKLNGIDVDTNALAERLHGLRQRLEKFEQKQLMALAEIRLDVHNLGQARSKDAPREDVSALSMVPAVEELQPVEPEMDLPDQMTDETQLEAEAKSETPRAVSYLDAVRKAAIHAHERKIAPPAAPKPVWLKFWHKRRWVILTAAAVLVGWFDAYVFAHYQPAQGAVENAPLSAAKPGISARAQLVRGLKYLNGTSVPVDTVRARSLIERAALRADPVAENLMGVFYQTGTGGAANMPAAISWYGKAAGHGNLKAMTNLGKLYAGGWQEGTDFSKAAHWFGKAAAAGDVDAAFDLAVLYERGLGVSRNVAEAYRWYAIAGGQGDTHAATRASILSASLPLEVKGLVDKAVAAFRPAPVDRAANEAPA